MTAGQAFKKYLWIFVKYFSVVFFSFIALLPIVSCVITALKTKTEYENTNVMTPPENWFNFENFVTAFRDGGMGRAFLNSALIVICVVVGSVLIGSMIAYVLNRFKFPGNGLIRSLFLFATLLPGIAMQVATYQLMFQLKFIDTLYGYIILSMGTDVISIYVFIQFFENISVSLDESAFMDGASYFKIFYKILSDTARGDSARLTIRYFRLFMPSLLKPAIVTCAILKGVGIYNEYYNAMLYLTKPDLKTVSLALYTFTGPFGNQYNLICAGVIMTLLPALILFIAFQNQIYSGLTAGAVKG